jgi:phosphoribosylaminoimidazolecarboxamide formyltransferase/IMP cyclohydrolase
VLVAPDFDEDALAWLAEHKEKARVVAAHSIRPSRAIRSIAGGLLVQTTDTPPRDPASWRVVTERAPSVDELASLSFAWRVVEHVSSNAIVFAHGLATVGIGAGQMNRLEAVHLAVRTSGARARGAVCASDAFFPFPDGLEAAAEAGVTAFVQPGGSIRDDEVTAAADRLGVAMVHTGARCFRH